MGKVLILILCLFTFSFSEDMFFYIKQKSGNKVAFKWVIPINNNCRFFTTIYSKIDRDDIFNKPKNSFGLFYEFNFKGL